MGYSDIPETCAIDLPEPLDPQSVLWIGSRWTTAQSIASSRACSKTFRRSAPRSCASSPAQHSPVTQKSLPAPINLPGNCFRYDHGEKHAHGQVLSENQGLLSREARPGVSGTEIFRNFAVRKMWDVIPGMAWLRANLICTGLQTIVPLVLKSAGTAWHVLDLLSQENQ